MTRKRIFAILGILSIVALVQAAPWSTVRRGHNSPQFDRSGVWIGGNWRTGTLWMETVSKCDPAGRVLTSRVQWVGQDPADHYSESLGDFVGQYVRTGKNTYDYFAIGHFTRTVDGVPNQVWAIIVFTGKNGRFVDRNTWEYTGIMAVYLADQDADGDGLPDPGQEPVAAFPYEDTAKRFPLVDVSGPWPEME